MTLFYFFLILFLFTSLCNFLLLFLSVNKKSPKIFIRYFFLSIFLVAWLALILQQINEVAYVSARQILGNLVLSIWVCISLYLNKNLKLALLSDFLNKIKSAILNKDLKRIILMVFYISLLQIICFSPIVSLNFLSGPSSFYLKDFIFLTVCVFGIAIYLKAFTRQEAEQTPVKKGFLSQAMHPKYFGNLIFILGLFLLSTGATGGIWSLIGPVTILLLMYKIIIPENERMAMGRSGTQNQIEANLQ
jgi:steroid 5-alpha reductase family enzyme